MRVPRPIVGVFVAIVIVAVLATALFLAIGYDVAEPAAEETTGIAGQHHILTITSADYRMMFVDSTEDGWRVYGNMTCEEALIELGKFTRNRMMEAQESMESVEQESPEIVLASFRQNDEQDTTTVTVSVKDQIRLIDNQIQQYQQEIVRLIGMKQALEGLAQDSIRVKK